MKCENCRQDNPPEASFCANCGAKLVTEVEPPSPEAELGPPKLPKKWLLVGVIIAILAITGISVGIVLLSDGTEITPPTTTTPPPTDTTSITFPDANLEAAIRGAINKPQGPINKSDLEALTTLEAPDRGISDLTGLEYCVNLSSLYLRGNNISDISPLAELANLQPLDLGDNNISDISALAGLTNLEELYLGGNNTSDLSPLADLTHLPVLVLVNNNISDISALAGLTNLESLHLTGNNISDIHPLAGLTNLWELWLGDNNISDISALAGLSNLEVLVFDRNNISDISLLLSNSGLSDGDIVDLSDNPLSTTTINIYIPQLEARGVTVIYDAPREGQILFRSDRDGNNEIYVMNADGSNPTNLTNNPTNDTAANWSPDGQKIVFRSDRDGNNEIYVMNLCVNRQGKWDS